ncbi:MAG: N-acetylglucosamine repressor [Granulosicoccus sp.]|jgi:N-acetylglucosamine repressor
MNNASATSDLRRGNRRHVLKQLAQNGPMSRSVLSVSTGLTVPAISRITQELRSAGLVSEVIEESELPDEGVVATRGRRTRPLSIDATGAFVLTLVVSFNRRSVGVSDAQGNCIEHLELPEIELNDPESALEKFSLAASSLISRCDFPKHRILGVSVVIAANTTPNMYGTVTSHTLGWVDVPVLSILRKHLNYPLHLETRAVALLQTELWHQTTTSQKTFMLVNVGWLIGTGVMVNDRILESGTERLGQLAHMTVQTDGSLDCYCGRKGCLDTVASGAAVVQSIEKLDDSLAIIEHPVEKLDAALRLATSNAVIQSLFHDAGFKLGLGLQQATSLFQPSQIYLAGSVGRQPHFIRGVEQGIEVAGSTQSVSIQVCNVRSDEAAARSGLTALLLSEKFDFSSFMEQRQRA